MKLKQMHCYFTNHQLYSWHKSGELHIGCHRCHDPYRYTLAEHIRLGINRMMAPIHTHYPTDDDLTTF